MADDKSKSGPADAMRVNVHEEYEVRYWCDKFKCTKRQLQDAVAAIGPMAKDVETYLVAS